MAVYFFNYRLAMVDRGPSTITMKKAHKIVAISYGPCSIAWNDYCLMRPQFSPLLMRYMVISLTPYFSASFLMVIFRFLSLRTFLMPLTFKAFSLSPTVRFACTFFVRNFCRAILLVFDHFFKTRPFQVLHRIFKFIVIDMNHILVFGRRFLEKQSCNFPVNVQRTVVAWPMQVKGFVAGSEGTL